MNLSKKLATIGLSTALLVGGMTVMASSASAVQKCQSIPNGLLCVEHINNGYNASYTKSGGATIKADFNLRCKIGSRFGDNGAFYVSAGERRTYFFAVGDLGDCRTEMYVYDNNTWYYSAYSVG
ncbi:hypothetical protein [Streptomyces sp. NPDC056401]|uniref:hypothetical protein n=1 Tax=Streptomyces sp. NPDC056401 TaxID=3345809 RepID=UPI0035D7888B